MKLRTLTLSAMILLSCTQGAAAQDLLIEYQGPTLDSRQGTSFAPTGDLDGDGVGDLVCHVLGSLYPNGGIRAISGVDGTLLWDARGAAQRDFFGYILSGGDDLSGDGVPDVVLGIPGFPAPTSVGRVEARSGVDGSVLYTLDGSIQDGNFGISIDRVPDLTGDGVEDLVIGSNYFNPADYDLHPNRVAVHSGRDGALVHQVQGVHGDIYFSHGVCGLHDISGDGVPDFALTASLTEEAIAYSGADASVLRRWSIADAELRFQAISIDNAGDLDGDGIDDVLVGANSVRLLGDGTQANAPAAIALSITSNDPLWVHFGREGDANRFPSYHVDNVGDANADGTPDVGVGSAFLFFEDGSAELLSGTDGMPLYRFEGRDLEELGKDVEGMGDVNGDGFADLAFSLPAADHGVVRVVSGAEYFCSASPKHPQIGDELELSLALSDANAPTLLVLEELDGLRLDRALFGLVRADGFGRRTLSGTVPSALQGRRLSFRAYSLSTGGLISSTLEVLDIQ